MKLSLVIPVFNEADSLSTLYSEICDATNGNHYDIEVIFIDDGSTDQSWQVIEQLSSDDIRVKGLRFRRNFGKAAALEAGFQEAKGDIIITMDADLQDDPHEISGFLEMMKECDVVSGWKKVRHDPWHKVMPSWFFNKMVSSMTGVQLHDHNCGMKCYKREIFDEVHLYGELHRFIPVLANARGFRVGEKVVKHRARQFGYSKYGFTRFVKGFLDLFTVWFLTGYGERPQHFMGTVGLLLVSIGSLILFVLAAFWGLSRVPCVDLTCIGIDAQMHLGSRPALLYGVACLLFGGQILSMGIIAELLVAQQHRPVKKYSIQSKTKTLD
ncbi:MAG: glycosyltransferase family 2 protein [Thermoguttaceae bacterium]